MSFRDFLIIATSGLRPTPSPLWGGSVARGATGGEGVHDETSPVPPACRPSVSFAGASPTKGEEALRLLLSL